MSDEAIEYVARNTDGHYWTGIDQNDNATWSPDPADGIVIRNVGKTQRVTFYGELVPLTQALANRRGRGAFMERDRIARCICGQVELTEAEGVTKIQHCKSCRTLVTLKCKNGRLTYGNRRT